MNFTDKEIVMNQEQFFHALKEKNINLTSEQKEKFEKYYECLIEWNQKVDLTTIVEKEEVYLKHFYDSITAAFYYDFNHKDIHMCDVGAGAGFPSIPLKICFPHIHLTIVDSLKKRITFLEHLIQDLQIEDHISLHHSRAEDFGQQKEYRESFDVVTARAVARMAVLSELCLPLVKKSGTFIALKGSQIKEEIDEAKRAIDLLGGKIESIETFHLPIENSERSIVLLKKERKSPQKYPRRAGTPNRNPIKP